MALGKFIAIAVGIGVLVGCGSRTVIEAQPTKFLVCPREPPVDSCEDWPSYDGVNDLDSLVSIQGDAYLSWLSCRKATELWVDSHTHCVREANR